MYAVDRIEGTNCTDGDIRLVGDSKTPHRGRLEICRGQVWGTVCASHLFSTNDAITICRSLGYEPLGLFTVKSQYSSCMGIYMNYSDYSVQEARHFIHLPHCKIRQCFLTLAALHHQLI